MLQPNKAVTVYDIIRALKELKGEAQAVQIKDKVTSIFGGVPLRYKHETSFRETIQGTIEKHCPQSENYCGEPYFERIERGRYRLIVKTGGR